MSELVPDPEVNEHESEAILSVSSKKSFFLGPIPSPEAIKGYEEASPGSADRILKMAEAEQRHTHEMERMSMVSEIEDLKKARAERRLGQIFAFLITIILGGFGTVAILNGQPIAGSILGASGVTGVVSVFITGRRGKERMSEDLNPDKPSLPEQKS